MMEFGLKCDVNSRVLEIVAEDLPGSIWSCLGGPDASPSWNSTWPSKAPMPSAPSCCLA